MENQCINGLEEPEIKKNYNEYTIQKLNTNANDSSDGSLRGAISTTYGSSASTVDLWD